ncbi:MAG: type II secretion system F family protein [Bacillota bacterium]
MQDFPAVLDLLAVATASGLALGQALDLVCSRHSGPFSAELRWALDQTAAGVRLPVALKRLAGRTGLKAVRGFASALEQAVTFGSPVAQVLRLQAGAARVQRRREIETHIAGLPLKLSLCTVFFFLPAIMVFVILPNLLAFIHGQW